MSAADRVTPGSTANRQEALDSLYRMGATCCAYSSGGEWADRCDCKYGLGDKWPTVGEKGNGCPELRSLYVVVEALTDEEWALLVHRAGGTPRGFVFEDDLGSRLHRAEAAAAMAADNIAMVRSALQGER